MAEETTTPIPNSKMTQQPTEPEKGGNSEPKQDPNNESLNEGGTETADNADTAKDESDELEETGEDEEAEDDDEAPAEEEEEPTKNEDSEKMSKKQTKKKPKGLLEYDLSEMYPELSKLVENQRRDWNFSDPEIIRAIWLETKTNALAKWKMKHGKIIKKREPTIPVQSNHATQLRNEYKQSKKDHEKEEMEEDYSIGRDAPQFQELALPTTVTAQMRYRLNRDNPPVPEFYIHHFAKYRKPPFICKIVPGPKCKPY